MTRIAELNFPILSRVWTHRKENSALQPRTAPSNAPFLCSYRPLRLFGRSDSAMNHTFSIFIVTLLASLNVVAPSTTTCDESFTMMPTAAAATTTTTTTDEALASRHLECDFVCPSGTICSCVSTSFELHNECDLTLGVSAVFLLKHVFSCGSHPIPVVPSQTTKAKHSEA